MDHQPQLHVLREGSRLYARLLGPLNGETVPFFQQRLDGELNDQLSTLALDIGAADYLDSDGVRWLQRLQTQLSDRNRDLRLTLREGCRAERTLHLLKMERAFTIDHYPDESWQTEDNNDQSKASSGVSH